MRRCLSLFLLILSSLIIYSQEYKIDILDLEDGLSNNYITSITQDRHGFLWFSTESGLNKFDGYKFTVYEKDWEVKNKSINCNELNKVYADPEKDIIWIATQREGLNEYNYQTGKFTYYRHEPQDSTSIITNDITDIISSKDGNLWVATYHGGVDYFDKNKKTFTHYNISTIPDLSSNQIWTIKEDNNKNLYIGHVNNGLSIVSLKDRAVKNFLHDPSDKNSIPGNEVTVIFIDKSENIWVGTNNGLSLFNPDTEKFISFCHVPGDDSSLAANYVYNITQMDDGKIYIGLQNGGISILDIKNTVFVSPDNVNFINIVAGKGEINLSNPSIKSIFQDQFRNIWIGTYGGGINYISSLKPLFHVWKDASISSENGLSHPIVWGICADRNDNLWIGTDGGGINYYEKGIKKRVITKETNNLNDNAILCALKDSEGNLWFGTFSGGVSIFDYKKRIFTSMFGVNECDVRHFFEDKDKNIWIATNIGFFSYNLVTKQLKKYDTGNSPLEDNLVRSISQDNTGNLWIGTFGEGVMVVDKSMNLIKRIRVDEGLYSNTINHIFCDIRGYMWIATGEGLGLFKNMDDLSEFKIYTTKDGLTNNHIRAITDDLDKNVWVSTNKGINKINADTTNLFNYTNYNGVPLGIFMNGSVTKTSDGKIYFGSQNGLCFFDPKDMSTTIELAPIAINSFIIYDTQIDSTKLANSLPVNKTIQLSYKQNTFQVSFNTLNYTQSRIVEYAYMLEGFDDRWFTLQNDNSVTFRNIPSGNYILHVKARIKNQEWDNKITTLEIIINPPIWLTWWAKLLYVLIILSIVVYIIISYKRKLDLENSLLLETEKNIQVQNLNEERLRFYTNITHELRTPLTLIMGPLDDLQKDKSLSPKHTSLVSIIHKSAERLLNLINQILEFRKTETQNKRLKIEKGDISKLINEVALKYIELNVNKGLSIKINVEAESTKIYFDPDVVTTIVDNLLSNALKYTIEGDIVITLREVNINDVKYTEIVVKDTGTGISKDALSRIFDRYYREDNENNASGTGIGLALVYNLVQLHQGEISVESEKGVGSAFTFRIKTNNTYPDEMHITHEEQNIINVIDEELQETSAESTNKAIVLVVEDNEEIRAYIKDSLCDYYEVVTAKDGVKGLELAQNFIPDIIISDIMMPEMDGIEMCRLIKKDIRTSHIPVVLLTAKDSVQDRTGGYEAGADSYIVKPFNSSLLHSRITNLLDNRRKMAKLATNDIMSKGAVMMDSINKLDNEFLEKVTGIIEQNMDSDKIDIAFIASKMNMSHSTFYRKIKALTGKSANEYIRKIKMKNAEQLLLSGKYTISEVTFMIGMNSLTYFRQCFKDEFGLPPSEYLKYIADKVNKNMDGEIR